MSREEDIQKLCRQILETEMVYEYNSNGADSVHCPLCFEESHDIGVDISEFKHDLNCSYLIAKDLMTNIKD